MENFVIEGGRKAFGKVKIDRAKNSLLPIISACIAVDGTCFLEAYPRYKDTDTMLEILTSLGGKFRYENHGVSIDTTGINNGIFPYELSKNIRASIFMLGAVLHRTGKAITYLPGGCNIGERPIDIHLYGLKKLGARVEELDGRISLSCEGFKGAEIVLPYPSVGATENLIISASVARGRTVIKNCALEPEVVDLAKFLNLCGAKIYGAGSSIVEIEGVKTLRARPYLCMPDRIEAGTFALLAMLLGGEIEIIGHRLQNIFAIMNKTQNSACKIYSFNDKIYIKGNGQPNAVGKIVASPYPGFPTDLQPQVTALLSVANGRSEIIDTVFPKRFAYTEQLNRLGAKIEVIGNKATINGVERLYGGRVFAEDLRGGAGLLLACLKAEGNSCLYGAHHVDRGYYKIEDKLASLGLKIKREAN